MTTHPRRHLLVVASQCRDLPFLDGLEEAARGLHDALADAAVGGCAPGLPDGGSLHHGELAAEQIEQLVRAAAGHAARHEATLVLALLGHGFIPGTAPTLYLMGLHSRQGVREGAVDVRRLLLEAADRPGVNGVVGIIDTCTAAAAQPSMAELATGTRGGRTRLALLMAAAVGQDAYELRLSRGATGVLRAGVADAGLLLDVHSVATQLRRPGLGQDIVVSAFDGDPTAVGGLWLGHNVAYRRPHRSGTARAALGRVGAAELRAALSGLPEHVPLPAEWTESALRQLREQMEAAAPAGPEYVRAARAADSLLVALRTTAFLRTWLGAALTSTRLRRAAAILRIPVADRQLTTDADLVEHVALSHPVSQTCRMTMVRFLILLAADAGLDVEGPELRGWAESVGATVQANDAAEAIRTRSREQRLRLIVSLHASIAGDWPETLGGWLLCDGDLYQREEFPCEPSRAGVEAALASAIDWAEEHAAEGRLTLRRVDVAIPTPLLLRWRPEEVEYGARLGVDYDVVTRWSERLSPPHGLRWINTYAAKRLEEISAYEGQAPIDWLAEQDTRELRALHERLRSGAYTRAIGLSSSPGEDQRLMEMLLAFSPILLWPDDTAEFRAQHRDGLDTSWPDLPAGFLVAYRQRWRAEPAEAIADLRAVWDDRDWLEFCRYFQRRLTDPPRSP
ncbi:hypothetical protein [Phytohabitans houttuyneae]|uniref:vWA-MoxR associated protein middle region 2 domain-containing protein n=1 Tax=Phytohabitans houttuyneae TaxID=1076126 RepID=A0A6V8KFY5_9ACTN|nr:hypothetical protein [Phytohabitans houttuyneae]GFJ81401.1 hypothetical protein Phou_055810 [Phytohabitans houttuyneae]